MSTTIKVSRGKPVTLAKSASGSPEPANPAKAPAAKAAKSASSKPKGEKPKTETRPAPTPAPSSNTSVVMAAPSMPSTSGIEPFDGLPAKWNELMKAQTDAAMAWWQDAKDAKTLADALAINARHSRVQFELAAGQAREMAALVQKSFEQNAERLRTLLGPQTY